MDFCLEVNVLMIVFFILSMVRLKQLQDDLWKLNTGAL